VKKADTIHRLLDNGQPQAAALSAPGAQACSFQELRQQVSTTVGVLRDLDISRHDRVAMVLANGPVAASAFVSISAAAITAPLNPAYTADEFTYYLEDLEAALLVVETGSDSSSRDVAQRLGVKVVEIEAGSAAGLFQWSGSHVGAVDSQPGEGDLAGADDVALILHTSGTTSRPKMVPLSHRNLCVSAYNVAESLALVPEDRCLNIMPLFHIHGLVAAILASLGAGAGVVCTPGFNALKFYSWLKETEPTWYTAVPTMHQSILDRAPRNTAVLEKADLRFVRSSSASLPPTVMKDLENTFSAPVIEAYGMTEAAHQMACNPLPPAIRKPGTVGPAAGPSVAIMDEQGSLQPTGSIGEVVIRGANVASGYLNNPEANASAFHGDWFRTGDEGVLDEDGYLRLTGRLKEIINRGGEKISPREIDEVMLDHPAVAQVVTFAIPHPRLGEDVAVAIVLDGSQSTSEAELRSFARERLAPFKVPRKFVFVDEMPKGATGKLQRIGLAEKLGVTPAG